MPRWYTQPSLLANPNYLKGSDAFASIARIMTWLDKLERRIGFLRLLDLDPVAVMHGEVWRLVTYIFIPQMASMLPLPDWVNVAFYILFLWWMGNGLDQPGALLNLP